MSWPKPNRFQPTDGGFAPQSALHVRAGGLISNPWHEGLWAPVKKKAQERKLPVLFYFGQSTCGHCVSFDKNVANSKEFWRWASYSVILYRDYIKPGKSGSSFWVEFGIDSTPTFVLFPHGGGPEDPDRVVGYVQNQSPDEFIKQFTQTVKYPTSPLGTKASSPPPPSSVVEIGPSTKVASE